MRYRLFGNGGLRVSELCLGTMTFGEDWGRLSETGSWGERALTDRNQTVAGEEDRVIKEIGKTASQVALRCGRGR